MFLTTWLHFQKEVEGGAKRDHRSWGLAMEDSGDLSWVLS